MSRPTLYNDATAAAICDAVAAGRSLRALCAADGMPGKTTVFRWLQDRAEFREQYARAKFVAWARYIERLWDFVDDADRAEALAGYPDCEGTRMMARKYFPQPAGRFVDTWTPDKRAGI